MDRSGFYVILKIVLCQLGFQTLTDGLDKALAVHGGGGDALCQTAQVLGHDGGTAIVILIALYFVIKWAVKNGIKEAYSAITGKKTDEDIKNEKELKELGLDSENQ